MEPIIKSILQALNQALRGKQDSVRLALTCVLANGHLLIEDQPGMGKTTLSRAMATVLGLDYARIQFTSDLLPSDMLGMNVFHPEQRRFEFRPGPLFQQLILADELNRASPKTQSALLEAMEEKQITIDGETRQLPSPFIVVATQNPADQAGTYALPESQTDRFMMCLSLGYPDWQAEFAMLKQPIDAEPLPTLLTADKLITLQHAAAKVKVRDPILHYILALVTQSRRDAVKFPYPLSPRASKALVRASQAWAFIDGRDFVIPDDVKAVFTAVCEHRLRGRQQIAIQQSCLSQPLLNAVDPLAA